MESDLEAIKAEKIRLEGKLKNAILEPERDRILALIKENDAAVNKTIGTVSKMNTENVALREQLIQSYFDLGNLFYDLGRYENAVEQYDRVLQWNPNHAWAHHNLAVIYDYHMHKIDKAIKHYREYLHLKLPNEDAGEVRVRVWDLKHLTGLNPEKPLREEFAKNLKA